MKATTSLLLLALLLLTGCSQDIIKDSPNIHSGKYIAFNPLTGKSDTRAEVVNNDNLENFAVWAAESLAIATPTLVLDNELVYRDTQGDWTYEPPALWKGNTMDFYAYAPALSTNARYADGVITYTVPTETTKGQVSQEDFLIAKNLAAPSGSDVTLQFQHALSRAVFRAKSEVQQVNLVIKRVTLNNLYSTGTLNFATSDIPETGTFAYDAVNHDPATTLWIPQTSMVEDYDVAITQDVTTPDSDNTSILITNEMKQIHRNADALMVLPQTTTPASITDNVVATPETSFYIAVNWALASKPGDVKTTNFPVVFPDTGTQFAFEAGRQYTFDITMTAANGVATINLKPSVSDWQPYNNEEDEIPDNIPVPRTLLGKPWPIGSKGTAIQGIITGVEDDGTTVNEILYFIKPTTLMADLSDNPLSAADVIETILTKNPLEQPSASVGTWEAGAWSEEPVTEFIINAITPVYGEATERTHWKDSGDDMETLGEATARGALGFLYTFWSDPTAYQDAKVAIFGWSGIPPGGGTEVVNYLLPDSETPATSFLGIDTLIGTLTDIITHVLSQGKGTEIYGKDLLGKDITSAVENSTTVYLRLGGGMIPLKAKKATAATTKYVVGDYYPNPKVASTTFVYSIDGAGNALKTIALSSVVMPEDVDPSLATKGEGLTSYTSDSQSNPAVPNYGALFNACNAGSLGIDYPTTASSITSYYNYLGIDSSSGDTNAEEKKVSDAFKAIETKLGVGSGQSYEFIVTKAATSPITNSKDDRYYGGDGHLIFDSGITTYKSYEYDIAIDSDPKFKGYPGPVVMALTHNYSLYLDAKSDPKKGSYPQYLAYAIGGMSIYAVDVEVSETNVVWEVAPMWAYANLYENENLISTDPTSQYYSYYQGITDVYCCKIEDVKP